MKRFILYVLCFVLFASFCLVGEDGKEEDKEKKERVETPPSFEELTPEAKDAINRGLRYIVQSQSKSGSFGTQYPVAVNALSILALMANGNTPTKGPYAKNVERGLKFLMSLQSKTGYFNDRQSSMYGHGFATLALAEAYGMEGRDKKLRKALRKAIKLIESSQDKTGGWVYQPNPTGQSDISITVCQTMALRAARNVGIRIDPKVIDNAFKCVKGAQNSDGGFSYRVYGARGSGGSAFPRSAGGTCILYHLGKYNSPEVGKAIAYLARHKGFSGSWYFYAHYYAAQAMFQAGDKYFKDWFPSIRDRLLKTQRQDGSWTGGTGGQVYSTAMACIILQVPYRYLPILQR